MIPELHPIAPSASDDLLGSDQAALALHQTGRLDEAARVYEAMLAGAPDDVAVLRQFGALRLQQGRAAAALALFERAVSRAPGDAAAQADRAAALQAMGQAEAALAGFRVALVLDPGRAESHYGLGAALQAAGDHAGAEAEYRAALAADADYIEAELGLALALQTQRRPAEALPLLERIVADDPDLTEAWLLLGSVLDTLARSAEAAEAYRALLAREPDNAEVESRLGSALQALDRHAEALLHHRRAVALAPSPERLVRLGTALQESGALDAALDCYRRATALDPRHAQAILSLVAAGPADADAPLIEQAAGLLDEGATRPPRERATLHFALGKAHAKRGADAVAFDHFSAGNRLRFADAGYDEAKTMAGFARIAAVFDAALMARLGGQGDQSELPVFIVGMPRSGSTLIEQILASHPRVAGTGERGFLEGALRAACGPAADGIPESVRQFDGARLRAIAAAYLARLRDALPDGGRDVSRITDKLLSNFALVGLIRLILPRARIIHARRDPVDCCLSCFTTVFADVPYAYDLGALGRYHAAYERLMAHWRAALPAGAMLELHYEDMVADAEGQTRRLLDYCGLPWDDACLAFHRTARPVRTASLNQVRRPIYASSVGRWRPAPDVLQPLLDGLAGAPPPRSG